LTPEQIFARLEIGTWDDPDREHVRRAARVAARVYDGVVRDQGTPYVEHPVAVAVILRDEAGLGQPHLLVIALLHDALEIRPGATAEIACQLGNRTVRGLQALTPDHRLAGRRRGPGDDEAYHDKIAALSDDLLAVKLADRVHNLRDLPASGSTERSSRFLAQLTGFYLPLARSRGQTSAAIAALAAILAAAHDSQWPAA
jgi:(p)ppGpp synthase/HD superfamily hydrolase